MDREIYWKAANELRGNEFKMFSVIGVLENNDVGYCFASNKGIASKVGLKPDTVSKTISSLKKKRYLYTIEIGKKGNHVDERRVYTADNRSNYEKDSRKEKIIPTQYELIEGIPIFYNEDNPKDITNRETIGYLSDRAIRKTSDRTIGQKSYGNGFKINTSKENRRKPILSNQKEDEPNPKNVLIGKIMHKDKEFRKRKDIEDLNLKQLEDILKKLKN